MEFKRSGQLEHHMRNVDLENIRAQDGIYHAIVISHLIGTLPCFLLQMLMPFLFLSLLFFSCTCNKLNKVKVGSSFRIAHEEISLLFLRGHKELEPRLRGQFHEE